MPKIVSSEDGSAVRKNRSVKGVRLFISEKTMEEMIGHAESGYLRNEEVLGLMTGYVLSDDEGEYVTVVGTATSRLDADDVSVRFDRDHLEDLFGSMDSSEGDAVVGWYHSHPGFGCYLSDTDIKTHEGIFSGDVGFALVVDPADSSVAAFGCTDGKQEKVPFVISED